MATIQDDFNNVVSPVNEAGAEVNIIADNWSNITTAGKTAIKEKYVAILEESVVNIEALITRINSL